MPRAFVPRPHQAECLKALKEARRRGDRRALIVMASGLGKTVTSAHFALSIVKRSRKKVLFLCHNNDILVQARRTFEAVIGGKSSRYGYFNGREKNRHRVQFLFANFQTMRDWLFDFDPEEFALVVVDEGHHGPAATYRPTIEHFRPEFLLGMTATPERMDLQNIREIYGNEVYSLYFEEAIARGLLTPVRYELVTDKIVEQKLRGLEVIETSMGKMRLSRLNKLFAIPLRDQRTVELIGRYTAGVKDPRIMVFCPSIEYCEWLKEHLPGSLPIHSELKDKDRAERLDRFRSGDVNTILTVDAFNEGIDVPEVNVVVFLRSTASKTILFQQLGRALRKLEGKDEVLIIDLVGNCERLELLREVRESVRGAAGLPEQGLAKVKVPFEIHFTATAKKILEIATYVRGRLSKAQMIADLKKLAEKLGRTPMAEDIKAGSREGCCASVSTYAKTFGSIRAAQQAAGLKLYGENPSREELLDEMRALAAELGKTPTGSDIIAASRAGRCHPLSQFFREFGTLTAAQREVGLTPNLAERKPREQLVEDLQALAQALGRTPRQRDIDSAAKEGRCAPAWGYADEFGSIPEAQRAAGLEPNVQRRPSREQLIADLKTLADRLGKIPSYSDIKMAYDAGRCGAATAYLAEFGSLHEAQRACGFTPRKVKREWRREELLEGYKRLAARVGRAPTYNDIEKASKEGITASSGVFRRVFGSIQRVREAAGVEDPSLMRPNREQLIEELKRLAGKIGKTPGREELTDASRRGECAPESTYVAEFGSIRAAHEAAGLRPTRRARPSREQMIEDLKALGRRIGRTPKSGDIFEASREGNFALPGVYRNVFGSLSEGLKAAGFLPNRQRRSREQMIDELRALADELGRLPTQRDIAAACTSGQCASIQVYVKTFGSILEARRAAGLTQSPQGDRRIE